MTSYGVNTVNRFDLLSDEAPRVAAPAPVAKPADSFENQKPSSAPNARAAEDRGDRGRGGRGRGRGGRGRGRGASNLGAHGQNAEFEAPAEQVDFRQTDAQAGERRRSNRLPGQTRQRFQDGHTSGRGFRGGVKRQGRGAFNVGHVSEGAAPVEVAEQTEVVAEAAPVEEAVVEEVKEEVPVEEEDNTLTLDQYLAKKAELLVADDLNKNLRVGGQDVAEEDFNPAKTLSREDEEDDTILGGGRGGQKASGSRASNSVAAPKAPATADFFANSASVFNRSRGGRGNSRRQAPVNVADPNAFPTLGKR